MRVVSLCPSLTELVFDLGRGADLVGVTKFCVHPAQGVAAVEKVGGTKDPKVARIVELAPDLVLMNDEENRREDYEALVARGLRCSSTFPKDVDDAARMVREVARELGRAEEGEAIAAEIDLRAALVRERARSIPRVRFAYLVWRDPWIGVGADTFVDGLLGLAGGENVLADRPERYPTIEPAELASARPDVVLLSSEPFPFREPHRTELSERTGLPLERLVFADGELLSWHGSRTRFGIAYAERCLVSARVGAP